MVAMRLSRKGMKKRPFYRLVVADKSFARDGRFIEIIGTFDPMKKESQVVLKNDRVKYWLDNGAQPSKTVKEFLKKHYKAAS